MPQGFDVELMEDVLCSFSLGPMIASPLGTSCIGNSIRALMRCPGSIWPSHPEHPRSVNLQQT